MARAPGPTLARPQQLPLPLPTAADFRRERFVVGPSNAAAMTYIERWPDWPAGPSGVHGLVLHGPAGTGKSHLGAIWSERAGARRIDGAAMQAILADPLARGTAFLMDAEPLSTLPGDGLFALYERLGAAGGSLLVVCRVPPARQDLSPPDIASRLSALPTLRLDPPDEGLLAAVLAKLFADRQLCVDAGLIAYLLRRIERSVPAAMALVAALDRAALAACRPVTRALAADILDLAGEDPESPDIMKSGEASGGHA